MSLSTESKVNITLKKISGKAHTSNDKGLINESLPSGISLSSSTIFGESIPETPDNTAYYTITDDTVEYLRLPVAFIPGTDTSLGRHAFEATLPSDYESNSSNPFKGIYPFQNGTKIQSTKGKLQLVPTSFGAGYEAKPFYDDGVITQIPVADERNWALDYFNGILFQETPPGTGANSKNPAYIDAYLYIGDMLKTVVDAVSAGGSAQLRKKYMYQVSSATSAGDNLIVPDVDFSFANFNSELIDIYVNGMIVVHADNLGMTGGEYTIVNAETIQFDFELDEDDIITIAIFNKSVAAAMIYNEIPTGTMNSVNSIFTLENTPISGITLSLNGTILNPTTSTSSNDYIIAGNTISLSSGFEPSATDVLLATYSY